MTYSPSDQAHVNIFQADSRVPITVYTQLRFVLEKLEWFGEDEARATTLVAGFMNCKSKAKVGNRSVILRSASTDNKATLKVTLTDGDHVEPNKLTEIETTRVHHSELMKVLNPIPNKEIISRIAPETAGPSVRVVIFRTFYNRASSIYSNFFLSCKKKQLCFSPFRS